MNPNHRTTLAQLFGDYRAEWSEELFAKLFITPPYFPQVKTKRPCFLIGGRGTGKTTALRSLRFDKSHAHPTQVSAEIPFFGIYIRLNKNRVRAFQGPDLRDEDWRKAFAHYFNLLACRELAHLHDWLCTTNSLPNISPLNVSAAFGLPTSLKPSELAQELSRLVVELEVFVNNPRSAPRPVFSMAESPLRFHAEALEELGLLAGKAVFCCVDEYENLLDYQQSILNTYIKHAEPPLSYKVGVRKNGLRTRATIDGSDLLATPDDYLEIDIAESSFESFAKEVVEHRLREAVKQGLKVPTDVTEFLPDLPFHEEAVLLGCERIHDLVRRKIEESTDPQLREWFKALPAHQSYFLEYWSNASGTSVEALAQDWSLNPKVWSTRLQNHGYASLFWLSTGRKGAGIKKYYAGSNTFLALASGNIRYFLELIDETINRYLEHDVGSELVRLPPRCQTDAAQAVGKRRLDQVEGLSVRGVELKRLLLAVGKVFFEFARDPVGRTPEQNAFVLTGEAESRESVVEILKEGVAHLVFEAGPRTKATSRQEVRDDEYRLHPIFCAFFEFSHRRKRRVTFKADALLSLATKPADSAVAIKQLLGGHEQSDLESLPTQLAMFAPFFHGSHKTS